VSIGSGLVKGGGGGVGEDVAWRVCWGKDGGGGGREGRWGGGWYYGGGGRVLLVWGGDGGEFG